MRRLIATAVLAAGISISGAAHATPSTHIWSPSSDLQGYGVFHIHHDLYIPTNQDNSGQRVSSINDLGMSVGVLPFKKLNAELGFDYRSGLGVADDYPLYFNAKIGLPENSLGRGVPSVAVGAYDFGTKRGGTDFNLLYAKVGWTIPGIKNSFGRVSIGYFSGNDILLLNEHGVTDNRGVMAAWERTMPEISDKLWLCVDYQGTNSIYGAMNYGAAWKFSENVGIIVGYDILQQCQPDQHAYLAVGYRYQIVADTPLGRSPLQKAGRRTLRPAYGFRLEG